MGNGIYPSFTLTAMKESGADFSELRLVRSDRRDVGDEVARLFASQTQWLMMTLRTILGAKDIALATGEGTIALSEGTALRIGLLLSLVDGVYSWKALINLGAAVAALSTEECYYFYAKINGTNRPGAVRKGLRLMLAG